MHEGKFLRGSLLLINHSVLGSQPPRRSWRGREGQDWSVVRGGEGRERERSVCEEEGRESDDVNSERDERERESKKIGKSKKSKGAKTSK